MNSWVNFMNYYESNILTSLPFIIGSFCNCVSLNTIGWIFYIYISKIILLGCDSQTINWVYLKWTIWHLEIGIHYKVNTVMIINIHIALQVSLFQILNCNHFFLPLLPPTPTTALLLCPGDPWSPFCHFSLHFM